MVGWHIWQSHGVRSFSGFLRSRNGRQRHGPNGMVQHLNLMIFSDPPNIKVKCCWFLWDSWWERMCSTPPVLLCMWHVDIMWTGSDKFIHIKPYRFSRLLFSHLSIFAKKSLSSLTKPAKPEIIHLPGLCGWRCPPGNLPPRTPQGAAAGRWQWFRNTAEGDAADGGRGVVEISGDAVHCKDPSTRICLRNQEKNALG